MLKKLTTYTAFSLLIAGFGHASYASGGIITDVSVPTIMEFLAPPTLGNFATDYAGTAGSDTTTTLTFQPNANIDINIDIASTNGWLLNLTGGTGQSFEQIHYTLDFVSGAIPPYGILPAQGGIQGNMPLFYPYNGTNDKGLQTINLTVTPQGDRKAGTYSDTLTVTLSAAA